MKQFKNIFRTILVSFICFLPLVTQAQADDRNNMDSVEIGLITCSPHEEIYSLYGHTALRYHDLSTGMDYIFNYGVFNTKTPHFVTRFIFGLTDYELGLAPTRPFLDYYAKWGSQVTEQVLNLTNEEKQKIINALRVNYLPENRTYRYNYFYDNCSTRPRDIIEQNINGSINYHPRENYEPSFREMIRQQTRNHPWATLGNDLLLGIKADCRTSIREQEFLPANLRHDFDHASIIRDGKEVPLVKERRELITPGVQVIEEDFPLTPFQCSLLLLMITILITANDFYKKKATVLYDALLMLPTGLAGLVLFMMIFSEHPTTSINLQLLILNPLSLIFIWPTCHQKHTWWFKLSAICCILFFVGGLWQDYAEGMEIVALCLLLRAVRRCYEK